MTPGVLGVAALAMLWLMLLCRVGMMRLSGVKAFVLINDDKGDLLLLPFLLFIAYLACAGAFAWPVPNAPIFTWIVLKNEAVHWAGVAVCALGLIGAAACLISFGNSLRVGIDRDTPGALVTDGVFSLSRNPLYVCFITLFLGLLLIQTTIVMLMCVLGMAAILHNQVIKEEAFLKEHYGVAYADYCRRVRRYL